MGRSRQSTVTWLWDCDWSEGLWAGARLRTAATSTYGYHQQVYKTITRDWRGGHLYALCNKAFATGIKVESINQCQANQKSNYVSGCQFDLWTTVNQVIKSFRRKWSSTISSDQILVITLHENAWVMMLYAQGLAWTHLKRSEICQGIISFFRIYLNLQLLPWPPSSIDEGGKSRRSCSWGLSQVVSNSVCLPYIILLCNLNSFTASDRLKHVLYITLKTFGLLQPYFGHLSCMPVVYVTCYKLQGMLLIWFKA